MLTLTNALEEAIKNRVASGNHPVTILTGFGDFEKEAPCFVISCQSDEEFPVGSSNYRVLVECSLFWPAEREDKAAFDQLSAGVFGLLDIDDLGANLTLEGTVEVYDPIIERQNGESTDGSMWVDMMRFTCYCHLIEPA